MKSPTILTLLAASIAPAAFGALTVEQKLADFTYLSGLYARNYAAYEWKRDVLGFDLYDIQPWVERVKASKDDLDYYDICVRYVASLQDAHDSFTLLSDFIAYLPFDVDIYDGKVLIEKVYRDYLPKDQYPFNIGDELVAVDGRPVEEMVTAYEPYAAGALGNPRGRRRAAAFTITSVRQIFVPRAPDIGDYVTIVIQDPAGKQTSYVMPWRKAGRPLWTAGVVSNPKAFPMPSTVPLYMERLRQLQAPTLRPTLGVAGWGARLPSFDLPSSFQVRLGARAQDELFSGTFSIGGRNIGFLRFSSMGELSDASGPSQLAAEIAYLQANTDGLVIDVMRNQGGSNCYAEDIMRHLMTKPFRGAASRLRANQSWLYFFLEGLSSAKADHAPKTVTDLYEGFIAQIENALRENRGITGPLPICTPDFTNIQPQTDVNGKLLSYTKPIVVLVDEFTASAAELIPAILQDEGRGTVLGMRTSGAGGAPGSFPGGAYSGGSTRVTQSMATRARTVTTPGFPATDQIENVGVYPDIVVDFMTRENLMTRGKPFVDTFSRVILDLIAKPSSLPQKQ